MKRFLVLVGAAAATLASPASATHVGFEGVPFATRGACESFNARLSASDRDFLQIVFPQYFSTAGDVESFLAHAWSCERNPADGQWYLANHIEETLESEWFLRKQAH